MYCVYVLYSPKAGKPYTGMTADLDRRLLEHNETATKGFTKRFRPWTLIHTETFSTRSEAAAREKFLKSGQGREEIRQIVNHFLSH